MDTEPLASARAAMRKARAALEQYENANPSPDPERFQELFGAVKAATEEYSRLLKVRLSDKYKHVIPESEAPKP